MEETLNDTIAEEVVNPVSGFEPEVEKTEEEVAEETVAEETEEVVALEETESEA